MTGPRTFEVFAHGLKYSAGEIAISLLLTFSLVVRGYTVDTLYYVLISLTLFLSFLPSATASVSERVISILNTAQNGHHNETKLVKEFKKLEESHTPEEFFSALLNPLKHVLLVPKKEPAVERCIKLIAHFTASSLVQKDTSSSDDSDQEGTANRVPILLLKQLIAYHEAKNKAVRLHVCQMIGMILEMALDLNEEITLPDDVSDVIQTAMMTRLHDKSPAVRAQAVLALRRFQDVQDLECPVVTSYIYLLQQDTAVEVRKAVLNSIGINKRTLPVIIERTRDINASLRQTSYVKLAEGCTIRHLSIGQRVQLLQDGLQDRSNDVQKACICNLLRSWSQTLGDDFLRLLQCCDVEASPQVAELALSKLFEYFGVDSLVESMESYMSLSANDQDSDKENTSHTVDTFKNDTYSSQSRTVPIQFLSAEVAFYWRCLCKYLKSLGAKGEHLMDRVLPSISEYCEYLVRCVCVVVMCNGQQHILYLRTYTYVRTYLLMYHRCRNHGGWSGYSPPPPPNVCLIIY